MGENIMKLVNRKLYSSQGNSLPRKHPDFQQFRLKLMSDGLAAILARGVTE